ncbi:MAG TPA: DUF2795 domain-containing protein [Bacteroidales bacterium]|jgi:hypothetical protein|nr:DUF2795 domain-containing protein [Bacteroidales bacterium]
MPRTTIAPIKVQKFLKGVNYPANRQKLIEAAKRNKADTEVISLLERLKGDAFNSPAEVSKGIGEID